MAAYVVGFNRIHDADLYAQYLEAGSPTLEDLEGVKVLAFADACERLDGEAPLPRCVIVEFPDMESARAWYESPAYQEAVSKRLQSTEGFSVLVEGLPAT